MVALFIDTWFLIALFDTSDSHHAQALEIDRRTRGRRLVTHDGILSEFLAFIAEEGRVVRTRGVTVVRNVIREHIVIPADRNLFERGLQLYDARADKEYSHVDCMSMALMKERAIQHVVTNDHHFRQEGFTVVNE